MPPGPTAPPGPIMPPVPAVALVTTMPPVPLRLSADAPSLQAVGSRLAATSAEATMTIRACLMTQGYLVYLGRAERVLAITFHRFVLRYLMSPPLCIEVQSLSPNGWVPGAPAKSEEGMVAQISQQRQTGEKVFYGSEGAIDSWKACN